MKRILLGSLISVLTIVSVQAQHNSLIKVIVPGGEARTQYVGNMANNIMILPIEMPAPNFVVNTAEPLPAGVASTSRKNYNGEPIPPNVDYVVFDGNNCFIQTKIPSQFYAFKLKNGKLKCNTKISYGEVKGSVSVDTKNHLIYIFEGPQYKCVSYKNRLVFQDSMDIIINPQVVGINDGVIIASSTMKRKISDYTYQYEPSKYHWLIKFQDNEIADTIMEKYVSSTSSLQEFYVRNGEMPFSNLKEQYSYHITYDSTMFHIDKQTGSVCGGYYFNSDNSNNCKIVYGRAFETDRHILFDIINTQAKRVSQTGIYNKANDRTMVCNLVNDLFDFNLFGKCIGTCKYGFIYSIPVDNNFKLKEKAYEVLSDKQIDAITSVTPGHCFLMIIDF